MNRYEIFELLGVKPRGLQILSLQVTSWGQKLTLECIYDPEEPKAFEIVFEGCKQLTVNAKEQMESIEQELEADVIFIFVGKNNHQAEASVVTDLFDLGILYKEIVIEKSW